MNAGATFWLITFACSALLFFGIAAAISVLGFRDLRRLLKRTHPEQDEV